MMILEAILGWMIYIVVSVVAGLVYAGYTALAFVLVMIGAA